MSSKRNWTVGVVAKLKAIKRSIQQAQRLGANNGNVIPHPDLIKYPGGAVARTTSRVSSDAAATPFCRRAFGRGARIRRDHAWS